MRVFQLITALLLAEGVFSEHHKKAEHVGLSRRGIDDADDFHAAIAALTLALSQEPRYHKHKNFAIHSLKELSDGVPAWKLHHDDKLLVAKFKNANSAMNDYLAYISARVNSKRYIELKSLWESALDELKEWNALNIQAAYEVERIVKEQEAKNLSAQQTMSKLFINKEVEALWMQHFNALKAEKNSNLQQMEV